MTAFLFKATDEDMYNDTRMGFMGNCSPGLSDMNVRMTMATDVRWYTVYIFPHSYSIDVMRFIIKLCHDGYGASQCSVIGVQRAE